MPRGRDRLMDYLARRDMARGRGRRDYGYYGVRGGERYPMDGNYTHSEYADERGRRDYESGRQSDMGYDYGDMRGRRRNARGQYMSDRGYENEMDGHYGSEGKTYYPIEAMGRFNGYWGMPEQDYGYDMARGGRGGNRGGRDRGYDYGYDYAGDYGENLTKEELEHWRKKLEKEVDDEQSKQFFKKENVEQKARQLGIEMKHFNSEELAVCGLMLYSDYCMTLKPYVGQNMDIYLKLARDFMEDKDSEVKGGEKLAVYKMIVSGEED